MKAKLNTTGRLCNRRHFSQKEEPLLISVKMSFVFIVCFDYRRWRYQRPMVLGLRMECGNYGMVFTCLILNIAEASNFSRHLPIPCLSFCKIYSTLRLVFVLYGTYKTGTKDDEEPAYVASSCSYLHAAIGETFPSDSVLTD